MKISFCIDVTHLLWNEFMSLWNNLIPPLCICCKVNCVSVTLLIYSWNWSTRKCFEYYKNNNKRFPPFYWWASNSHAGKFPLNIHILSLIGMPSDVSNFSLRCVLGRCQNTQAAPAPSNYVKTWLFNNCLDAHVFSIFQEVIGEVSVVITWIMSKHLWSWWKWQWEVNGMPSVLWFMNVCERKPT